jgi:choline dehydrogenase-like flavoprotein
MIFNLKDAPLDEDKHFDVCIFGSGPAGITLALQLAEKGVKVGLFEAGSKNFTTESNDIYQSISVGLQGWFDLMRKRFFGGTSNQWLGRCRPFEASDFERSPLSDFPGWPITIDDIVPYQDKAMEILNLDKEIGFRPFNEGTRDKLFNPDVGLFSAPITRFGEKYGEQIRESKNIELYLNANLCDLTLNDTHASVVSAKLQGYGGKSSLVQANSFVMAMGGIENARILLNCDSQVTKGIGNHSGFLGRCFMEHPNVIIGQYVINEGITSSNERKDFEFYSADKLVKEQRLTKGNFTFQKVEEIVSHGRTGEIKSFFKNLSCSLGIDEKVQFISNFNCPGSGIIWTEFEQLPSKNSRVYLSEDKDSLGLRKAIIDWNMTKLDIDSYRRSAIQLAKSFSDSGFGKIRLKPYILNKEAELPIMQHAHHMGTTRMASNESEGVVDANCKVFGVDNLYVAGSSIFPTVGCGNPTLPIVKFALRLADHLQSVR